MEGIERKEVIISEEFYELLLEVYVYGEQTFGVRQADKFIYEIFEAIDKLETRYLTYAPCRFIKSPTKKYRNMLVGSYYVIYRIAERVEVLAILHSSTSIRKIRQVRRFRL